MRHKRPLPPYMSNSSSWSTLEFPAHRLKWQGMLTPLRTLLRTQWLAEIHVRIHKIYKKSYVLFDVKPEDIAVAS